jgi:hypothetical protein
MAVSQGRGIVVATGDQGSPPYESLMGRVGRCVVWWRRLCKFGSPDGVGLTGIITAFAFAFPNSSLSWDEYLLCCLHQSKLHEPNHNAFL